MVKHTKIHLFDSVHSNRCGQAHLSLPKVILKIKSAICQDWIELWCGFYAYSRLQQKQQIDTVISSGLQ